MENITKKLESLFRFNKKHDTILGVIEALSAAFSGAFIHGMITHLNKFNLWFGIITTLLFLYLFYRRLAKEANFSLSGLGELAATAEVKEARKDIERKILIDTYIDDAVKALNSNTCDYNEVHVENHLCDQSLQKGLISVCQPFFTNPQNLLNSSRAKFTVGAYVDYFLKLPPRLNLEYADPVSSKEVLYPEMILC